MPGSRRWPGGGNLLSVGHTVVPNTAALFENTPIWNAYVPTYGVFLPLLLLADKQATS